MFLFVRPPAFLVTTPIRGNEVRIHAPPARAKPKSHPVLSSDNDLLQAQYTLPWYNNQVISASPPPISGDASLPHFVLLTSHFAPAEPPLPAASEPYSGPATRDSQTFLQSRLRNAPDLVVLILAGHL